MASQDPGCTELRRYSQSKTVVFIPLGPEHPPSLICGSVVAAAAAIGVATSVWIVNTSDDDCCNTSPYSCNSGNDSNDDGDNNNTG